MYAAIDDVSVVVIVPEWSRDVEISEVLTLTVEPVVVDLLVHDQVEVSVIRSLATDVLRLQRDRRQLARFVQRLTIVELFLDDICNTSMKHSQGGSLKVR